MYFRWISEKHWSIVEIRILQIFHEISLGVEECITTLDIDEEVGKTEIHLKKTI